MSRKKKALFVVIVLVAIFGVAELGFRWFFSAQRGWSLLELKSLGAYAGKPWADEYFGEVEGCAKQVQGVSIFTRYIMHDTRATCVTKYSNLDGEARIRKSWNPEPEAISKGARTYTVAFFGGSTMAGVSVPDEFTIPSHFSKLANAEANTRGIYYFARNYGVSSYTFTQSLMKLILRLREGERFDYVVFYSGANDIDYAYAAGEAGALYNEKGIRNKLEGGFGGQLKEFIKTRINSCGICRAVLTISRNAPVLREYLTPYLVKLRRAVLFQEGARESEEGLEELAKEIAGYYVKSHELLDALSGAYGFRYAEFWQPSLMYGGGPVGDEEKLFKSDNRLTDEKLKTLYRLTREYVRAANMKNFYDISDALDGRPGSYYLDAVHIGDDGNGMVAERMFELIGDKLSGAL